jgi:hypothetical protein
LRSTTFGSSVRPQTRSDECVLGALRAIQVAQHADLGSVVDELVDDVQDERRPTVLGIRSGGRSRGFEELLRIRRGHVAAPPRVRTFEHLAS